MMIDALHIGACKDYVLMQLKKKSNIKAQAQALSPLHLGPTSVDSFAMSFFFSINKLFLD